MVNSRRCGAIAVLFISLLLPSPAHSQEQDEEAKRKFEAATEAFDRGDYQEARDHYLSSYELSPRPRSLFNLAYCEEKLGLDEEAYAHYVSFVAIAEDRDEELSRRAGESVTKLGEKLAATVAVDSEPSQGDVYVDGATIAAGKTPVELRLPPGSHKLVIRSGVWSASKTITVKPREESILQVVLESARGQLVARTDIGGGMVYVDGLVVGGIPPDGALRKKIAAGEHVVSIERKGYPTWRGKITVVAEQSVSVTVRFRGKRSRRAKVAIWSLSLGGVGGIGAGSLLGIRALDEKDNGSKKTALVQAIAADTLVLAGVSSLVAATVVYFKSRPELPGATVKASAGNQTVSK